MLWYYLIAAKCQFVVNSALLIISESCSVGCMRDDELLRVSKSVLKEIGKCCQLADWKLEVGKKLFGEASDIERRGDPNSKAIIAIHSQ